MSRLRKMQTNFNSGVLDPRLNSRIDIKQYAQGVSIGTNVITHPTGGLARRPGMEFISDIEDAAEINTTGTGSERLAEFAFSTTQTYLIVFSNLKFSVFKDGVWQVNVVSPWPTAALSDLSWTQSADTMIVCHKDYAPQKITRTGHTSWTIGAISFANIPQYDYDDASSPTPTSEIQEVTRSGTWAVGDTYRLELEGIDTETITFAADTAIDSLRIQNALLGLVNTASTGIAVAWSSPDYVVTFSGASAKDWDPISGRVISGSGSIATVTTQDGVSRAEDAWSAGRGYPKTVTFFENRLVLGGTLSLPQSMFFSATNDFFNFDLGEGLDDQGIFITMDTDQVNAIRSIFAGRQMQIFTSGGEFYMPDSPLTPAKSAIKRQTLYGASTVKPISIDGATLFIDKNGKSVREFVFFDQEEAYTASSVSILSQHLINAPVDMAYLRGTTADDANYVYIVNGDGTVAVFNTLRAQEIASWTEWTTNGNILSMVAVVDIVYLLVERTINSVTKYYIEKLNSGAYMDSSSVQTGVGSSTVTGLDHLDDESCRVLGDRSVLSDVTPSGGSATVDRSVTDVEVGLNFNPTITTMPFSVDMGAGQILDEKKRFVRAWVKLYESRGVYLNGVALINRSFADPFDSAPENFTGTKKLNLMGYSEDAQVTITQVDPLPMTILGLNLEVQA